MNEDEIHMLNGIVDYMSRLGELNPVNDQRLMNMDFASLYPLRANKFSFNYLTKEIKTPEDFIESWESDIEHTLQMEEWSFGFPEIQRIAARTIGIDLVTVQPMAPLVGILHYLDYVYNEPENE